MSIGGRTQSAPNPNVCSDPYSPSFWLGKPGALTQIRTPVEGYTRDLNDHFGVHDLLDGMAVDRSPYGSRTWTFRHEWLTPQDATVLMEYATRQRGFGPFILVDPHAKNLLTPNQASGTDALHTADGFTVTGAGDVLSSSSLWSAQGERSLLWQQGVPLQPVANHVYDDFNRSAGPGTWGNATSGQAWTITGGAVGDYGVNGTIGYHQQASVNVMRTTSIAGDKNAIAAVDSQFLVNAATGAPYTIWVMLRYTDQNNWYAVRFNLATTGILTYWLEKRVAGTITVLSSVINAGTFLAGSTTSWYRTEIYTVGTTIKARIYQRVNPRPTAWTFEVTDASLTTGGNAAVSTRIEAGGSGTPFVEFDNFAMNFVHGGTVRLQSPTGFLGWCLPPGATYAFSGTVKALNAADPTVSLIPQVLALSGAGTVLSTNNGATITTVTGSATTFCVTGVVPQVTGGVYLAPQFSVTDASVTDAWGVHIDQLQFELLLNGGTCTQWMYGQGQPSVAVQIPSEQVPRVMRATLGFIAVEVN